jgi:hypothetical protein
MSPQPDPDRLGSWDSLSDKIGRTVVRWGIRKRRASAFRDGRHSPMRPAMVRTPAWPRTFPSRQRRRRGHGRGLAGTITNLAPTNS